MEEKDDLNCILNIQDFASELRTHFTNWKRTAKQYETCQARLSNPKCSLAYLGQLSSSCALLGQCKGALIELPY